MSCPSCEQPVDDCDVWTCNSCRGVFHISCVRKNENIKSWSCPKCKHLRVPSPPKSGKSSKKSVTSNISKGAAEAQLELIEEETKILAKHREQKEKFLAEAEQTLREQQTKELELLKRKADLIRTMSDRGSDKSESSQSVKEKVNNWRTSIVNSIHVSPQIKSTQVNQSQVDTSGTSKTYDLSKNALAARHVVDVKLPKFDGNPLEWQRYYAKFTSTTTQCNITPAENIDRLSSSLSGRAYEAVKFKLLHPDNLDGVISTLQRIFGRDELVLNAQIQEMRILKPRMDPLDTIIHYALSVQNIAESMINTNRKDHLHNPLLLQEMVEKLPSPIKLEWAEYRCSFSEIDIEVFSNWLFEKAMRITEVMGTIPRLGSENKQKSHNFLNFHEHQTTRVCLICEEDCKNVSSCKKFTSLSVHDRWVEVKDKRLCRSCLKLHNGRCRANIRCNVSNCTARHNPLLHRVDGDQQQQDSSASMQMQSMNTHNHKTSHTLFKYVPIILYGVERTISTYAFLDDGSSVTVMDQSLADELGLIGQPEPLCLKWTSNESRTENNSQRVCVEVRGKHTSQRYRMNARTVNSLELPIQTVSETMFESNNQIRNLPIEWYSNVKPRVLIGLDNAKLTVTRNVRVGDDGDNILAGLTKLGWIVYGGGGTKGLDRNVFHICDCSVNTKLLESVESYIVQDNLIVAPKMLKSRDEERAIRIMQSTTKLVNGKYETGLIWKFDDIQVPISYNMAKRRLHCLERSMRKQPELARRLEDEIQSYISKGYAVKLNAKEENIKNNSWFLPIFFVKNPNKPDKIRLVWDAAAKTGNVSLNTLLLKGPDLLSSLPGILCRFRQKQVAITGDISEMFHQIQIRSEDRHFQRFLYRSDPSKEPDLYEMVVMIFGACCSPTSAQYVKNVNAERFIKEYPRACQAIIDNHYVDDLLDSVDNEMEAIQLATEVRKIHASGGFHIRGWASNKSSVTLALEGKDETSLKNLDMSTNTEKVLGMWWDTGSDTFTFSLKFNKGNKELLSGELVPTKREVLKVVMSVFDPLGLLSHLLVYAKILLQEIWREKIDWDSKISDSSHLKWQEWLTMLHKIEDVNLPRCYHPNFCNGSTELHVFVDGSESAYAAAVYARVEAGGVKCILLSAKTKVCPLKGLTVPRMELNAAVLGCRLSSFIMSSHNIEFKNCTFWSDSKTVISWLNSDNRNYHQYVSSRVAEILGCSNVSQWRWIPSEHNVSDLATKMKVVDLNSGSIWFNGPRFLSLSKHEWPQCLLDEQSTTEELKSKCLHQINFHQIVQEPEDHSTWRPLLRSRAYVCRFVFNLKACLNKSDKRAGMMLTQNDFLEAERALIKQSQRESYSDEVTELASKNKISKNSSLYSIRPYLSNEGVLMSKGRVYDTIILNRNNHITKLIIMDYHRRYHHHLHEIVVNELMQRFKIPKLRVACNSIIRSCQKCKNARTKPQVPEMADLPSCRLQPYTKPFSYIGIDYFGPIGVTIGRSTHKRYGVLITCLTVRAVHIEIAHSLNTDSCILALRNFMNRRGQPIEIYSDNATNFAGSSRELREEYLNYVDKEAVAEYFISSNTKWFFIPPASPHMGGAWERLVRSIKNTLQKISLSRNPSDELLLSMLIEVEHIVNTRPLTYIPLENESSEVLTPNHFLLGCSSGVKTYGRFSDEGELLFRNWKRSQQFANSFQKRWVRDYLPSLNITPKWRDPVRELKIGDVVFIFDEKSYGKDIHPKGIVTEVYPSRDGHVRKASVRTSSGIYVRPAAKLAILDVVAAPTSDSRSTTSSDPGAAVSGGSVNDNVYEQNHPIFSGPTHQGPNHNYQQQQ